MLDQIRKKVKNWMQRAGAETGLSKEFKDIFEVGGVPAFNQFYYHGIFVWKDLYKGLYKPWHIIDCPTIANPYAKREIFRTDMAKAICAELAGLIWSEQCQVHVSQGDGENQSLDDFVQSTLKANNFWCKMQEHIEQAMALGGGALKVWREVRHDDAGTIMPETESVKIGYAMADQFIPTAWDNARVTEGVFISRQAKNGYYYTRLEWHKWNGQAYTITNEVYRADGKSGALENQDILGYAYPLASVYPYLNAETTIHNLENSLFSYYRTAIANNIDDNSPLGVSIYANALQTLHALDIAFDSFVREFRLGKKRIIVPAQCVRTVADKDTGRSYRYFDANDESYEALATDDPAALGIKDNSVEIRVEEHVSGINALLSILCLQVGFSAGTFTFDQAQGLKTATEIISENSKTYKTIKSHQSQIREAVEQLVRSIIVVASLYDMEYNGHKIASLSAKDCEVKVVFDDSILQDRQTNINEGILNLTNGVMSKRKYMMDILGYTQEEAEEELEEIANEGSVSASAFDLADQAAQEGSPVLSSGSALEVAVE